MMTHTHEEPSHIHWTAFLSMGCCLTATAFLVTPFCPPPVSLLFNLFPAGSIVWLIPISSAMAFLSGLIATGMARHPKWDKGAIMAISCFVVGGVFLTLAALFLGWASQFD